MRLKSFIADSMSEAMAQIKEDLGEDAIIVTTRDIGGGKIRITAAIEQENRYGIDLPEFEFDDDIEDDDTLDEVSNDTSENESDSEEDTLPDYAWRPPPLAEEEDSTDTKETDAYLTQWLEDTGESLDADEATFTAQDHIEQITDIMLSHRFPTRVTEKLITTATLSNEKTLKGILSEALTQNFQFSPLPHQKHDKPIILVGPPGAGKTLNIAKLATRAVQSGVTPTVISTDITRAGGLEMLGTFLDILDLPLYDAEHPHELKNLIEQHRGADQILIDTGGLNPFDPHEMKDLAKLMRVTEMESVLVLPAGGDAEESSEMALTFELLGVKRIYPTRLDFARRMGGVMAAADRGGLSFAGASHTHRIPDGILDLSAQVLADLLMPGSHLKG